jgi:hypothetical protein
LSSFYQVFTKFFTKFLPMAYTEEELKSAAHTIEERGEQVTNESLRKELGGGSYRDTSEFVRQWKAAKSLSVTTNTTNHNSVKIPTEEIHIKGESRFSSVTENDIEEIRDAAQRRAAGKLVARNIVEQTLLNNPEFLDPELLQQVRQSEEALKGSWRSGTSTYSSKNLVSLVMQSFSSNGSTTRLSELESDVEQEENDSLKESVPAS